MTIPDAILIPHIFVRGELPRRAYQFDERGRRMGLWARLRLGHAMAAGRVRMALLAERSRRQAGR